MNPESHMFELKEPWDDPVNGAALESQFGRELHASHFLYKFKGQFRAVAKNESNDDVIFGIREMGYVLAHLTWSENEPSPEYPICKMLATCGDVQQVIDYDNSNY